MGTRHFENHDPKKININNININNLLDTNSTSCYLCGTLNYFHDGPDLHAPKMNNFHVNLNELDGKWYLMINNLPYPVKYCPNCGRRLDEKTKFNEFDWL